MSEHPAQLRRLSPRRLSPQVKLSLRAALCLTVPLVLGLATNQRTYGTLVALGTLWAVSQDGSDRWRVRAPRLLGVAVAAGLGIVIGSLWVTHFTSPWSLPVMLGAVAFVAGVIEASLWSSQGMYLLLGATLGGGIGFSGRTWQAGVAVTVGALWLYTVASLTDRRSRLVDQRACLFHAFRALANLLQAIGTDRQEQCRLRAVTLIDVAQDVIGTESIDGEGDEVVALHQCLVVAMQFGELCSYAASTGTTLASEVGDALRDVGAVIRYRSAVEGLQVIEHYRQQFGRDVTAESGRFVAKSFTCPARSSLQGAAPFRSTIQRLATVERLRYAGLLSTAIVAATLIAQLLPGPRGYWLPMSVAFIFRPDLGPVLRRAVARTVGTLAGVGIAALVALWGNPEILLIVLCCAMAAAVPWAATRSHALTVMVFTPIVFVFIGVLGSDQNLFGPRILDTALAALIVLSIDYVLWLHAPSQRPLQQLARAREAALEYERTSHDGDIVTRHTLRRSALRAVTRAHASSAQARGEPHLFVDPERSTGDELDELLRRIDRHTVDLIEHH